MNNTLEDLFDNRRALEDLIKYYEIKLEESKELSTIYYKWLYDAKHKLEELDVSIQAIQRGEEK